MGQLKLISGGKSNSGLFNHATFSPFQSRVPVPLTNRRNNEIKINITLSDSPSDS